MVFTALFTIVMPIAVAIVFYKKAKFKWRFFFAGAIVFTVMQIFIRVPILQNVLPHIKWYRDMTENVWIYAIFLGLTAGIFEEVGRYIAFKTVLKKHLNWKNSVAFGIGHGGIESILIVGLSFISNLIMAFMINNGSFETLIAPTMPQELITQLKSQLIDTPSYMFLVASLERSLTFIIHIGFSVLIMLGIRKGKGLLYLLLATLLHMLLDASAVIMSSYGVNTFIIEGFIGIFTIAAIVFLVKTGNDAKDKEGENGLINE
jgi:uncharacterized membrane protein YhfC